MKLTSYQADKATELLKRVREFLAGIVRGEKPDIREAEDLACDVGESLEGHDPEQN